MVTGFSARREWDSNRHKKCRYSAWLLHSSFIKVTKKVTKIGTKKGQRITPARIHV